MSDPPRDFGEQIRAIAAAIAGEVDLRGTADLSIPIVESAARSLVSTLERWTRNPGLGRLIGGVRRDVLSGPGEPVELWASLGVSGRLGSKARFLVGDAAEAEVEIGKGGEVHATIEAPAPGLYPLRVEVEDRGGTATHLLGRRVLQVASGRPVALVHAALFLAPDGDPLDEATLEALRALAEEAFELAYFDVHEEDRYAEIAEALQRHALPAGAILVHPTGEHTLETLGVDFVEMFATTAIRRLRAMGVPVTTILTDRRAPTGLGRTEHLGVLHPLEAARRVRRAEPSEEQEQAARLLEERARSNRLDWQLDQMTDSRLVEGNAFVAELDNRVARERLFEAIERAEASVHVQLYMVRPSAFTEQLVVHLIRRARAGARVRFMVDALYSDEEVLGRLNAAIQSLKEEPRIEVLALSPIESPEHMTFSRLKQRDHRKLVIVDGRRAFVSGRNADEPYYLGFDEVPVHDHTRHERIPWLDAHVEVTGPLVAEVQQCFLDTWQRQGGGAVLRDASVLPRLEPTGSARGRLVVHHGFADTNGLAMYEAMLDAAKDHAFVVNDFPFVPAIERAIRRAMARGVRVMLLTGNAAARRDDGTFFPAPLHRTLFEYMVKAKLEPLLEAGVEAYELVTAPTPMVVARGGRVRPYVHAKLMSVDGRITSIGSANLDATASYWESEANVVVQDETFARGVEAKLRALIEGSLRIDLESDQWKRERAQRGIVSTLWPDTLYA